MSNLQTSFDTAIYTTEQLNEIIRCSVDPHYFIRNYCYIYGTGGFLVDKETGKLVQQTKFLFKTYPFQDYVIYNLKKRRLNVIKKPRQMGISWLAAAMILWRTMFHRYQNVIIISIKDEVAKRLLQRIKFIYKNLPPWMATPIVNGRKGEFGTASVMEFENNSRINSIPSSEEAGRSEGVSWMVIDEAAFIEHMESIWAAAYPTLSTGGSMLLLSTTNGIGNIYHKVCTEAEAKMNSFNFINLTWQMHPDRDMKWYEQQRKDLGPRLCAQEVDCDFLTSGNNVFDLVALRAYSDRLKEHPVAYQPLVKLKTYFKNWEKVQMEQYRATGMTSKEPKIINLDNYYSNEFLIAEYPQSGKRYVAGVDTAKNAAKRPDCSAIIILDVFTGKTVFKFRGKISTELFDELVVRVGRFYNNAFLVIENTGIGLATVKGVKELGYPTQHMYKNQISKQLRTPQFYDNFNEELGFSTNTKSKPLMIATIVKEVADMQIDFIDEQSIQEFQTYVTNNVGGFEASQGFTDDVVMAYALAYAGMNRASQLSGIIVGH